MVFVQLIAQRHPATGEPALFGVLTIAAPDVLGELQTVVFCHALQNTFQNNTFRAFTHVLCDVFHPDTLLFAVVFVGRDFLAVPSESVNLPNNDDGELFFRAVR